MSSIKSQTSADINFLCTRLGLLGRPNTEWIDVKGSSPVVRKKSNSICSRIWKPKNVRMVPVFNKTLEFFLANKQALMDSKYVAQNKAALTHVANYFSTKKDMRLKLREFHELIDEMKPEKSITPSAVIDNAKVKAKSIIEEVERKFEKEKTQTSMEVQKKEEELENQKKLKAAAVEKIETGTKTILDRLKEIANTIKPEKLVEARNSVLLSKELHDVILNTKRTSITNEISVHAALLSAALKNPSVLDDASASNPVTLDIFKEVEFSVLYKFIEFLYDRQSPLDFLPNSDEEISEYLDFLHHPELNPTRVEEAIQNCIKVMKQRIGNTQFIHRNLFDFIVFFLEKCKKNEKLKKYQLLEEIQKKIQSLSLDLYQKIRIPILIAKYDPSLYEELLPFLKFACGNMNRVILEDLKDDLYDELAQALKKFTKFPEMKGICGVVLLNNPKATDDDKKHAVKLLKESYEKSDNLMAGHELAFCYGAGDGVDRDDTISANMLFDLYKKGYTQCTKDLITVCLDSKKMDERSIKFLEERHAQKPDDRIALKLGKCYLEGHGVQKDPAKALSYLRSVKKYYRDQAVECIKSIPIEFISKRADEGHDEDQLHMLEYFSENVDKNLITNETIAWLKEIITNPSKYGNSITKAGAILSVCQIKGLCKSLPEDYFKKFIGNYSDIIAKIPPKNNENFYRMMFTVFVEFALQNKDELLTDSLIDFAYRVVEDNDFINLLEVPGLFTLITEYAEKNVCASWLQGECHYYGIGVQQDKKQALKIFMESISRGQGLMLRSDLIAMKEKFKKYKF